MRKLISVLAISATLASCGKEVKNDSQSHKGLSVSGSKGINKVYDKSENLILYIENNSINMVRTELTGGADPNYLSYSGKRPLVVAAHVGSTEIVEELLRHNADPSLADLKGDLPIFEAIKHNNLGSLKALLQHTKDINILNADSESTLIAAVSRSNQTMSNILIKAGVDITLKDKDGRRPIEIARAKDLKRTLDLLIDVRSINKNGLNDKFILNTIKSSATETLDYITSRYKIKDYLNGSNAIVKTLYLDDKMNRSLMLNKLLQNKMSANGEEEDSDIPLIEAVKLNDLYSSRILVKKGAYPNKQDKNALTSLVYAARNLNYTLVDFLVQKGAVTEYEYIINEKTYVRDTCKFVPRATWRTSTDVKKKTKLIKLRLGC